ncbi:hypothetical protein [Bradyrhizobium sp. RDT46]|uniref:hypothetical protein n=1 Tax=Bradyrhizobium sp. RDT46 TaxID=3341829 RepID=UPI0035C69BE5
MKFLAAQVAKSDASLAVEAQSRSCLCCGVKRFPTMELAHERKSSSSPPDFMAQFARMRWSLFSVMPALAAAHRAKSACVLDETAQSRTEWSRCWRMT